MNISDLTSLMGRDDPFLVDY